LLQDQFRQAVSSAMPAAGATPDASGDKRNGMSSAAAAEPKAQGGSPLDVSGGAAQPAQGSKRVGRNPRVNPDKT
jgi:hypothetical protein